MIAQYIACTVQRLLTWHASDKGRSIVFIDDETVLLRRRYVPCRQIGRIAGINFVDRYRSECQLASLRRIDLGDLVGMDSDEATIAEHLGKGRWKANYFKPGSVRL